MKIENFKYENVLPNGTFKGKLGAVETEGIIRMSQANGGCNIKKCNCSNGHWLTIVEPRTEDGIVQGTRISFDNKKEMTQFIKNRELKN